MTFAQQSPYSFKDQSDQSLTEFSSSSTLISIPGHNDIDVSFKSTSNKYDENTTTEYLKVDIGICTINQVESIKTIRAYKPKDISLLFRFNQETLSLCSNSMKNEVMIPLNQLRSFKVSSSMIICFRLVPNFQKRYFRHTDLSLIKPIEVTKDPTNFNIEHARSMTLTPLKEVQAETLHILEAGINRLWFEKYGIANKITLKPKCQWFYITCYLPRQTRAVYFPDNENLYHFIMYLKGRFKLPITRLKYRSRKGDICLLSNDQDWESAKSSAIKTENFVRFDLFIE
ncbi:13538_t:CDS:2 [Cetraspora pellucida]|uniref:13538_t:CDS:1 n=1 Tax=Cetraspora pellucida TaxID=1433469 RepID=A0A9N9D953_9GLOM|nr:13538_t:CDS:2 [Cetraspora pellucida]